MNAPLSTHPTPPYKHTPLFPLGKDTTPYRKIAADGVRVERVMGEEVLVVPREALRALAEAAFTDINHLLRPAHLASLKSIVEDPEASDNDKFVAYDFLKNANIAAGGVLPMCQDTGTAIVMGKKGRLIWSDGDDEAALAEGARDAYLKRNLRYSQLAPLSMFEEKNTRNNMPAQVEIYAESHDAGNGEADEAYKFLFIAKGGGSANKAFLFQATPSILTRERMLAFLKEKVLTLGTAACPPYHLAIVIGGTSAELTMKTVKLASLQILRHAARARLRGRPRLSRQGHGARDPENDAVARRRRAIRRQIFLPRRARDPAAAPRRLTADRARRVVLGRPPGARQDHQGRRVPGRARAQSGEISARCRCRETRRRGGEDRPQQADAGNSGAAIETSDQDAAVALWPDDRGARLAHAKLRERLEKGQGLPDYFKNHPVYYAGPAKTPQGYASGAFGPTTAGRMDSFVEDFQSAGGSMVMLAKGNRAAVVRDACKKHGGFYLASIGGAAANLAEHCIKKVETLEYPELGMEAIWRIEVVDFPAFIVIDDKGNDFFKELNLG